MQEEIWKDIQGYEGYYQISNFGEVKSLARWVEYPDKKPIYKEERILTQRKDRNGYRSICLSVNGKHEYKMIHRLVAQAFIPNPNNFEEVNHKDENKTNNAVNNLEWCNRRYNVVYGFRAQKQSETSRITRVKYRVCQYDLKGNLLCIWLSAKEVERQLGFSARQICNLCNDKEFVQYKGYIWRYADSKSAMKRFF